ncbi:hypothetical protein ACPCZR_09930 [Bacillus bombysepticus]
MYLFGKYIWRISLSDRSSNEIKEQLAKANCSPKEKLRRKFKN